MMEDGGDHTRGSLDTGGKATGAGASWDEHMALGGSSVVSLLPKFLLYET